jgi:hypothetical protein
MILTREGSGSVLLNAGKQFRMQKYQERWDVSALPYLASAKQMSPLHSVAATLYTTKAPRSKNLIKSFIDLTKMNTK